MATNQARALLLVLMVSISGCTWFGLVEEEAESDFEIPSKGAATLIYEITDRTANVDFAGLYLEIQPHPVVRIEGRGTAVDAIQTLTGLMEESPDFKEVKKTWGSSGNYEEMDFGVQGMVTVEPQDEETIDVASVQDRAELREKILGSDFTDVFGHSLVLVPFSTLEWENEWSCEVLEMRYNPEKSDGLDLQKFLKIMKEIEMQSSTLRVVIARLWVKQGKVSRAILRWNCWQPPAE